MSLAGQLENSGLRLLNSLHLKTSARKLLAVTPVVNRILRDREVRNRHRLVNESELKQVYTESVSLLASDAEELGDYLEFGVYNGSSLLTMYRVLQEVGNRHSRLIGFDSFEGLPASAATDCGGHWRPGEFKCSLEFTRRVLDYERVDWNRIVLVKGFFDTTLTAELRASVKLRKASWIMVDCDLYASAAEALAFCTPLIANRTIVFFDDWYPLAERGMGEKAAFDEWMTVNETFTAEEFREFKPYGKAFLIRRTQLS
jgi:O-methyltransferase